MDETAMVARDEVEFRYRTLRGNYDAACRNVGWGQDA